MNATLGSQTSIFLDDAQLRAQAEQMLANPGPPVGSRLGVLFSNIGGALVLMFVLGLLASVARAAVAIFIGPEVALPVGLGLGGGCLLIVLVSFVRSFRGRVSRFDAAGVHFHFGRAIPWTEVSEIRRSTRSKTKTRTERSGNIKKTIKHRFEIRTLEIHAGDRKVVVDEAEAPYGVGRCRLAKALADWVEGRGDRLAVAHAMERVAAPARTNGLA